MKATFDKSKYIKNVFTIGRKVVEQIKGGVPYEVADYEMKVSLYEAIETKECYYVVSKIGRNRWRTLNSFDKEADAVNWCIAYYQSNLQGKNLVVSENEIRWI